MTYSALGPLPALMTAAAVNPAAASLVREMTGLDATHRADAAHLLLAFALADNPDGVVLVGTTSQSNIALNASIAAGSVAPFADPSVVSAVASLTGSVTSRPGERSEAAV
jgi:aryl-alcohol dehydrogenase-like predicted oxidoreductase